MSAGRGGQYIAVVDFGGQYTHLIARRVRNLGVFTEIVGVEELSSLRSDDTVGVILSGGPDSVLEESADRVAASLRTLEVPVLGICFGHQLLAKVFGGVVGSGETREYGLAWVTCDTNSPLFEGVEERQRVWMSHGDHVDRLPEGFSITVSSDSLAVAGFEAPGRRLFGLQFHPEVTHTENGMIILDNFVSLCTEQRPWSFAAIEKEIVAEIRKKARRSNVFLLVSGGVDSLVCLELCIRALGIERVFSLHVDTGFMRLNESAEVMEYLSSLGYSNIRIVDASDLFFSSLAGVVDPETKRRIIGKLFVDVVRQEIADLNIGSGWMLAQGTIYPDQIESGATARADRIKTHHNRVEEIEQLIREGRVIEPLAELYKNEVRELGLKLGSPEHLVKRRPFPGPGLAVRVICSESNESPPGVDKDEAELHDIAESFGMESAVLPVRSVGVQGDARTYHHPAVIWAKNGEVPQWQLLKSCALRVVNVLSTVNRVVFSPRGFERGSVELRSTLLNRDTVDLLRQVNAVVEDVVSGIDEIWQIPVVSLPLYDRGGSQVFVIRPVCSTDAMTADVYEMPTGLLDEIVRSVAKIPKAGTVLYDVTTKPPATIEWE